VKKFGDDPVSGKNFDHWKVWIEKTCCDPCRGRGDFSGVSGFRGWRPPTANFFDPAGS